MPGSGKTTLAQKLAPDLSLPLIGKDTLKEFLFDTLDEHTPEALKMLGGIALETMYLIVDQYLMHHQSIIIECPFYAKFAQKPLQQTLKNASGARIIEVHCEVSEPTRVKRVYDRLENGTRHAVHHTADKGDPPTRSELEERYAPLELGRVIHVNTEQFGDAEYAQLVKDIKDEIGANNAKEGN